MALHPQGRAYLDAYAELEAQFPPLAERSAAAWRAELARLQAAALEESPGPPVHREEDRAIPGPAGPIPVRILTPGARGPYPLLVWFHGGGWTVGGLDSGLAALRLLANVADCAIVSVGYRLAPEHPFPAPLDDCLAALAWAAANAEALGADARRLAVGGDSAGGNLAAVAAQRARDEGGPAIGFQLLVCPVADSDFGRPSYREFGGAEYLLSSEMMQWFWRQYRGADGDPSDPRVAPLRAASLAGLPPAHVVVAGCDVLRDEGLAYAAALERAGVGVTLNHAADQPHDYWLALGLIDAAERGVAEAARELTRAFQLGAAGPA